MSERLDDLAARKELVVARLQLQRMELELRITDMREALRPASSLGSAIARPAAVVGVLDLVAPLFGLRKVAVWARISAIALVAYRVARDWHGRRGRTAAPPLAD